MTYLVDANVLSEPTKLVPSNKVIGRGAGTVMVRNR